MSPQKTLRMAACGAAFASAAIHAGYFCVMHKLPVYALHESLNFSIKRSHWGATGISLALASLGAAFLIASLIPKPRLYASWLNLATFLFLVPAAYTGYCIVQILF
ncbi:MAG: hypothetical protein ACFUZC_09755 [Chthoniobacteraceae bacterium]